MTMFLQRVGIRVCYDNVFTQRVGCAITTFFTEGRG